MASVQRPADSTEPVLLIILSQRGQEAFQSVGNLSPPQNDFSISWLKSSGLDAGQPPK